MTEAAKAIYDALNTPGGLLILFIIIGILGWRGDWRWKRESERLEAENRFLRGLVTRLTGTTEVNTHVTERAVLLAEMRAKGELE